MSDDSLSFGSELPEGDSQGSLNSPIIFKCTHNGCHVNGYQVYYMPEMKKQNNQSCNGIFVHKLIDPPSLMEHSAEVVSADYISSLQNAGKVEPGTSDFYSGILFKEPRIPKSSRVRENGPISFPGPSECINDQVGAAQAPLTQTRNPYYFCHTLCLVKLDGRRFDNRVFSDHDRFIDPDQDTPNPVQMDWGDDSLVWHIGWRVAIQGSARNTRNTEDLSVTEFIRRRRGN